MSLGTSWGAFLISMGTSQGAFLISMGTSRGAFICTISPACILVHGSAIERTIIGPSERQD